MLYRNYILFRIRRFIQRFIYFFNKIKFQYNSFNKFFYLNYVYRVFFFNIKYYFISICDKYISNIIKFLLITILYSYLSFKFINNIQHNYNSRYFREFVRRRIISYYIRSIFFEFFNKIEKYNYNNVITIIDRLKF